MEEIKHREAEQINQRQDSETTNRYFIAIEKSTLDDNPIIHHGICLVHNIPSFGGNVILTSETLKDHPELAQAIARIPHKKIDMI